MCICVNTENISNITFNKLIRDQFSSNLLIVVRVSTDECRTEDINSEVDLSWVKVLQSLTFKKVCFF